MWIIGYLIFYAIYFTKTASARYCEGGHKCLPPKECCAQGCCYLYAPPSAPRSPPPATDHVLNLFFINHWYFWCFLFAIVLALLLCCSLWKKRRQLCGWGSPGHHSQSEMDSAGSCYAPPQYSRCSSFHHAPPPYAEVTSKPDLYPLVFSYTNDGSKNGSGANYLMVQYFRNYIVRPIGSLSGTSTVDSLSSSFICTANEANTLIPPPYSSAASPDDLPMSLHNYAIPRSASQQGYMNEVVQMSELIENQRNNGVNIHNNISSSSSSSQHQHHQQHYPLSGSGAFTRPSSVPNTTNYNLTSMNANMHQFRASESANFTHLFKTNNTNNNINNIENCSSANNSNSNIRNNCILIHQVPMSSTSTITTSHTASSRSNPIGNNNNNNSNTSDDEFNNSYGTGSGNRPHFNEIQSTSNNFNDTRNNFKNIDSTQPFLNSTNQTQFSQQLQQNKCTIDNFSNNNNNTISNFMIDDNTTSSSIYHSNDTVSSLSQAMAPPLDRKKGCNNEKLTLIQMQLEKCCQMIQQQQQQQEHLKRTLKTTTPCSNFDSASASPISMEIAKKIGESELMSYMNSNTGSTVSSLANLDSPGSPPQATSPTQEVKDLLEQIRQLKASNYESNESLHEVNLGKFPSEESIDQEPMEVPIHHEPSNIRRPTTLNNKRKFFNMKNKAVYLPISNNSFNSNNNSNMKLLRSPMSHTAMGILSKGRSGRGRTGWISKSAPTTPGTGLPVNNFMSDDSPLLLNEQDEDDNEHN